jgi:hypothetical protein
MPFLQYPIPPLLDECLTRHTSLVPVAPIYGVPLNWDAPIAEFIESLAQITRETGVAFRILQIKGKLGTLRVRMVVDEDPPSSEPGEAHPHRLIGLIDDEDAGSVRHRAAAAIAKASLACPNDAGG